MAEVIAGVGVLGAVSSVLQIVDFTSKLVSHARELYSADNHALRENVEIEGLARQYELLTEPATELERAIPDASKRTREQQNLVETGSRCRQEAKELLNILQNLEVGRALGRWARIKEGTKQAVHSLQARKDIEERRKRLNEISVQLSTAILQTRPTQYTAILDHLHFPDMQLRDDTISAAYPNTYRWALEDDSMKLKPWLQNEEGIFWITGKPGAGKSTLMRYIISARNTPVLLQQWAGSSELVLASFYFWYLGSAMQKSIEGLLRSILYQLIKAMPPVAGRNLWTRGKLLRAINDVIRIGSKDGDGFPTKKFCFFVDGLDEYAGNQLDIIKLFEGLTRDSGVKLCLSSRPWTSFRRAFEARCPYIRLEDITRGDIMTYVHGHIREAYGDSRRLLGPHDDVSIDLDEVDALVDDIVSKAEGVFVWVFLVVAYVERGLAEDDPPAMLRQRVEHFPGNLDQLFDELIFDRIEHVYLKQTCQALQLAVFHAGNRKGRDYGMPDGRGMA
ncbi:hypothetical protein CLAFUR4_14429 [Fulvia fulva]|nr:hypothetical protein CLAFUR4_14429 [Fulvia fulva]WPV37370.1 hypothetical protein CLAFUW7_14438 [Fulvia fulva]